MFSFEQFVFYFLALVCIVAAIRLITARNPVQAALFLVLAFVSCAGIWILLHAEFLGIALILVYVGAVMVLFLFVVMMLDINMAVIQQGFTNYLPIGSIIALIVLAEIILIINTNVFTQTLDIDAAGAISTGSNTKLLGFELYTKYLYPVELAAVLLTVAIVAAIALTLRKRTGESKYQNIAKQVQVKAKDRLKVVEVESCADRHQQRPLQPTEDDNTDK